MDTTTAPIAQALSIALEDLHAVYSIGQRNKISLVSHKHFGPKMFSAMARLRTAVDELDEVVADSKSTRLSHARATLETDLKVVLSGQSASAVARVKATKSSLVTVKHELNEALLQVRAQKPVKNDLPYIDPEVLGSQLPLHRKILVEVNKCYNEDCFNAAAVLLRRVAETLIIKAFIAKNLESAITDADGEYLALSGLIKRAEDKKNLGLSRSARSALPRLKFLGDVGAHSVGVLVKKSDLEKAELDVRAVFEELSNLL